MKRLTEIDEYGNADIIGMEDETWQMGLSFNDMNKMTLVLNRLHRLEKLYEHHKQPDPNTGLVPCGCGGRVFVYCPVDMTDVFVIRCEKCRVGITFAMDLPRAKKEWNTAMGWKGGAE